MKIHQIKLYQEFDASAEDMWEAFNDHTNFGKMMGQNVQRITDSPDPDNINGVHSVRRLKLPVTSFEETVRKSEKPDVIEYQITKGTPLHHHYGKMLFKSLPDGRSAMDYTIEIGTRIPLLGGLLKTVLEKRLGDGLKRQAERLKKINRKSQLVNCKFTS